MNSNLKYALEPLQANDSNCTIDQGAFDIDNIGRILVKDALYQYLDVTSYNNRDKDVCEYTLTATDDATEDGYPNDVTVTVKVCKSLFK